MHLRHECAESNYNKYEVEGDRALKLCAYQPDFTHIQLDNRFKDCTLEGIRAYERKNSVPFLKH